MSLRNCGFLLGMAGQVLKYRLHHLLPLEHFTSRRLIWTVKLLQRLLPTFGNLPEQLTDALPFAGANLLELSAQVQHTNAKSLYRYPLLAPLSGALRSSHKRSAKLIGDHLIVV